jgi:hypothetical protein
MSVRTNDEHTPDPVGREGVWRCQQQPYEDAIMNAMPKPIAEPANCDDLLGPPPVISGEDPKEYAELLERILSDLKPRDIIETAFVRDIADQPLGGSPAAPAQGAALARCPA